MNYYFYDKNKDYGNIVEVSVEKNRLFGTYWSKNIDYSFLASTIYKDIEQKNDFFETDSGINDSVSLHLIKEGIDVETNEGILKYCEDYASCSDWFKNLDEYNQYIKYGENEGFFGGKTSKPPTDADILEEFENLSYIGKFNSITECREFIKSKSLFTTS